MYKTNDQLYRTIINNIAKEVKRTINETYEDVEDFGRRSENSDKFLYFMAKDIAECCITGTIELSYIPPKLISILKNNPEVIKNFYNNILSFIEDLIGNIDRIIQKDLNNMKIRQNAYLNLTDDEFEKYAQDIDSRYGFTYNGKFIGLFDIDQKEDLGKHRPSREQVDYNALKLALCTFQSSVITKTFCGLFLWMVRLCLECDCKELINPKVFNLTNILNKEYKANPKLVLQMTNIGSIAKNAFKALIRFKKTTADYQTAISTSPVMLVGSIIQAGQLIFCK